MIGNSRMYMSLFLPFLYAISNWTVYGKKILICLSFFLIPFNFMVNEVSPQLVNSPWPMFMHNPHHTARSPYIGPLKPKFKWAHPLGRGQSWSSPVIDQEGTIYVGSADKRLYAIKKDGRPKWSFETGAEIHSTPCIGLDGTIYVTSNDGYLYAITPEGSLKWKLNIGQYSFNYIASSPVIGMDSTIFVGSGWRRSLYAVSSSGQIKWEYKTEGDILSSPALGPDGTIYFGTIFGVSNLLYALNQGDGSLKWRYEVKGGLLSSPAIAPDGTIYIGGLWDKIIYALTPNGTLKWSYKTEDYNVSSPAIGSDRTIYIGSGNKLYAINPDGSLKWVFNTNGRIDSSPAIGSDGSIYVGSNDGYLYAIDPEGEIIWSSDFSEEIYIPIVGSPIVGDDSIYVKSTYLTEDYTLGERLYAIGAESPTISLSSTSLSFSASKGGSNPAPQTVSVINTGGGTLNWTASDDATWLSIFPTSGTAPSDITASADISGMSVGTYTATIAISATDATNSPQTVSVTLTIYDTTPPTISSFAITPNPTNNTSVTLNITCTDASGCGQVAVSNSANPSTYQTVTWTDASETDQTTTISYTLPSGDGTKTVYLRVKDTVGNTTTDNTSAVVLDTTPPISSFAITPNPTNNTSVTLNITCTDANGCRQVAVSNTANPSTYQTVTWTGASGSAQTATISYTLPSGDGTKTVYLRVKDTVGNTTTDNTSAVVLDTTPPTTIASPPGGTYNTTQTVALTCNDGTGSGCDRIYYTTDGTTPTTASSIYSTPISISSNTTLKYFSSDNANNGESVKSQSYIINSPPTASFTSPTSGYTSTTFTVDASGSTDAEDLVSSLEVRWDWENDGTWDTPYFTSKTASHQYMSPGTYTIKLEVKDTGGLTSTATRSITVSSTPQAPSGGSGTPGAGGPPTPTAPTPPTTPPPSGTITPPQTLSGTLSSTDSTSPRRSGRYADTYTFSGTQGQRVRIRLVSTDFDPYLYLIGPDGRVIAEDDDAGGNRNSLIEIQLPSAGTYTIEVTSYNPGTGSYTLESPGGTPTPTAPTPPTTPPPSGTITPPQTVSGSLSSTDSISSRRRGSYVDTYTLSGTQGHTVRIRLESSDFDPYLHFIGPDGRVVAEDDDGGGNRNSLIDFTLPATGTYTIEATSYSSGRTGSYTLRVEVSGETTTTAPGTITLPQTVNGTLSSTDSMSPRRSGNYADTYTFTGTQGQRVRIRLESSDFDPYLYLRGPDGRVIAENDDGGGGRNSLIEIQLPTAGTYTIEVTSYSPGTGSYTLRVEV